MGCFKRTSRPPYISHNMSAVRQDSYEQLRAARHISCIQMSCLRAERDIYFRCATLVGLQQHDFIWGLLQYSGPGTDIIHHAARVAGDALVGNRCAVAGPLCRVSALDSGCLEAVEAQRRRHTCITVLVGSENHILLYVLLHEYVHLCYKPRAPMARYPCHHTDKIDIVHAFYVGDVTERRGWRLQHSFL